MVSVTLKMSVRVWDRSAWTFHFATPACARAETGWRRGGRGDVNGPKVCLARPRASKALSAVMRAVSNGRHSPAVSSVCVWSRSDCVPIGDDLTL